MPARDQTGPTGQGPGSGPGRGRGQGGSNAGGGGRMGGFGAGAGGNCVCPSCGKTVPHQRGFPCNQIKCPDCNCYMTRQG